jgi:dephospho-CoA kinase
VLRVGLTGGIACGKSHVLRRLAQHGLHTLDLDATSREALTPGQAAHAEVVRAFGPAILGPDGAIDRKALAALVFADPLARGRLNAIVHPRVRQEESRWARRHAGEPGAVLVTDAALLVEAGAHLRFDRLVVVHCPPEGQLRRLMERDGLSEEAARARIDAQMPVAEKRRYAHHDVDTSGPVERTDRAADDLARRLREEAAHRAPRVAIPRERALGCLLHGPPVGPRGLTPARLLGAIAAAKGLEMERVATLLEPPAPGPWYRAARSAEPGAGPETLAGPLVLWALSRGGPDPAFLAAAAFSLARLTHDDALAVADACLFALVLQEVALRGEVLADIEGRIPALEAVSRRWAGPPSPRLAAVWKAARRSPTDPAGAREASRGEGIEPGLAGALVGTAAGFEGQAPAELAEALAKLAELDGV